MFYKDAKGILSNSNGINVYRGCSHGCIYCDSRSLCYKIEHDFEDIEVKKNALVLLEEALKKKKKKCMISTGSMSDPYSSAEEETHYTHKTLEIINKYEFGVTLHTKSNKVLNDLDVLKKINNHSKAVVQMTLTTFDEMLCQKIEPNVCTTKDRFEALKVLYENGIPTIVWLCPILPFINDTEENLLGLLDYCIKAHVKGILCFGFSLTLREGNREYFYSKLDEFFPGLKEKYIKIYGNSYNIVSKNHSRLLKIFQEICRKEKIMYEPDEIFQYLHEYPIKQEQLSLFD